MTYENFTDYLKHLFMEDNPQVLDDDLPDAFDNWLADFDVNDILEQVKIYERIEYGR